MPVTIALPAIGAAPWMSGTETWRGSQDADSGVAHSPPAHARGYRHISMNVDVCASCCDGSRGIPSMGERLSDGQSLISFSLLATPDILHIFVLGSVVYISWQYKYKLFWP